MLKHKLTQEITGYCTLGKHITNPYLTQKIITAVTSTDISYLQNRSTIKFTFDGIYAGFVESIYFLHNNTTITYKIFPNIHKDFCNHFCNIYMFFMLMEILGYAQITAGRPLTLCF